MAACIRSGRMGVVSMAGFMSATGQDDRGDSEGEGSE